jgi:hypothetical protein
LITDHYLVVANVRERLALNKQTSHRFNVERFSLKKLNEVECKEKNYVEVSNRFAALEDLDSEVVINSAWETIRVNVAMWKHRTFDCEIFRLGKFTTLTALSLLISCELSFPIFGLKMPSLPTLALNFYVVFRELIEHTFQFLVEAVLNIISLILRWGVNVQHNVTPATS